MSAALQLKSKETILMKINANVKLVVNKAKVCNIANVKVPVDLDYVDSNAESINEYVTYELEDMFGMSFSTLDFTIQNLDEIVDEILLRRVNSYLV